MSRQLDLQLYLLLNGYEQKRIPEDRYDDYMREPHYSTDPECMISLLGEMIDKGSHIEITNIGKTYRVRIKEGEFYGEAMSESLVTAVAVAIYLMFTGEEEWVE